MTRGSKTPKCTCKAYPYPHRKGSGKCTADEYIDFPPVDEESVAEELKIDELIERKYEDDSNTG